MRAITRYACAAAALALSAGIATASERGIKVGVLTDMSGPFADITGRGSVVAAEMAVEYFGPTVLGRPITIISADHLNKADVGSSIAREWLDRDKVDVIMDVPNSSVGKSIQSLTRDKNRAFLITGGQLLDFTGFDCSPTSVMWSSDTYAISAGTGRALFKAGATDWFILTVDIAFGISVEETVTRIITGLGGTVRGAVRHPLNTQDSSSFLLRAQSSGAKVIALANAGTDTIRIIKQAREFGMTTGPQKIAALAFFTDDVHALGLETAQGTTLTESFYWDQTDETRAWSERFKARMGGKPPTSLQAGAYGALLHYLKSMAAAGTDDAKIVVAKMKEMPVNDFYTKNVRVREDGRILRDFYLFEVKKPSESKYPWDYYKLVSRIPADEAVRPLAEGKCPFVKAN